MTKFKEMSLTELREEGKKAKYIKKHNMKLGERINLDLIDNIAFAGGGVKGAMYAGVVAAFKELRKDKAFKRITGASAGAISSVFLACGFTPDEVQSIMLEVDFNKFADGSKWKIINWFSILSQKGMHPGTYFYNWIKNIIETKTGIKGCTFMDLHKLSLQKGSGYADLYAIGTNLERQCKETFSFETTPDMEIALAIRISMSIPGFFIPVEYNGCTYVDGGVTQNYPVDIFDNNKYLGQKGDKPFYNSKTLGATPMDPADLHSYKHNITPPKLVSTNSWLDLFKAVIMSILDCTYNYILAKEKARTIYINNLGVQTTDFNIGEVTKLRLIEKGYKSTMHFCEGEKFKKEDNNFIINNKKEIAKLIEEPKNLKTEEERSYAAKFQEKVKQGKAHYVEAIKRKDYNNSEIISRL